VHFFPGPDFFLKCGTFLCYCQIILHDRYLIGCEKAAVLALAHTRYPELCDKVGGFFVHHIDDLRALAPLWLSKTEEVRADKEHYATKYTGDIYEQGWISEMYGYVFGASEVYHLRNIC
jgi:hypothetical protein